jgi:aromatic ring-cleaving dioxygenase
MSTTSHTIATFRGSLQPNMHPITMEPAKMNYSFAGHVVIFEASAGRKHATYLRGIGCARAMRYAESEAQAIGAHSASVYEAHAIPTNRSHDWSEEVLPLSSIGEG